METTTRMGYNIYIYIIFFLGHVWESLELVLGLGSFGVMGLGLRGVGVWG